MQLEPFLHNVMLQPPARWIAHDLAAAGAQHLTGQLQEPEIPETKEVKASRAQGIIAGASSFNLFFNVRSSLPT